MNAFAKALFVNTVGRLPDTSGRLDKLIYWLKFSRWCIQRGASRYDFRGHSYSDRHLYFERIVAGERLKDEIFDFLEFGVYQGESLTWWRDNTTRPDARFFGFDTFHGLPQNWTEESPAGRFTTNGNIPVMHDPRFQFEVGLFQDTLPNFLRTFRRRGRLIVHLDADLYSSTLYVLMLLGNIFEPGDLLLFDEFATVTHEFRAFTDFVSIFEVPYEVAYATGNFNKVCLKLYPQSLLTTTASSIHSWESPHTDVARAG